MRSGDQSSAVRTFALIECLLVAQADVQCPLPPCPLVTKIVGGAILIRGLAVLGGEP